MSEIILMSDPQVAAVPVQECGESMIDIRRGVPLLVDSRKQGDSDAYFYLREGVLERLIEAQAQLPAGLRLLIVEGYRAPGLQRRYFENYAARLRAEQPGWTGEQIRSAASRFVSPPEIAPHSAGAAVDLTLADPDGRELDLGTRMNATPEESAGACYTDAAGISDQARTHREILARALTAEGFVNYPTEWWHWSFGDRYWALITGAASACYGPSRWDARS
jgi:D-alanyl-D-alanine dipeptidase